MVLLSFEGSESPCPYIRFTRPFSYLEDTWEIVWGLKNNNLNLSKIKQADLVVMQRYTPGMFSIASLKLIFDQGTPVVYETDDLLHELPDYHPEHVSSQQLVAGIEYVARRAVGVVTSTPFLADRLRVLNSDVCVLPNFIDFDLFYRPVPVIENRVVHIGLLGTSLQGPNFSLVDHALRFICEKYAGRVKLFFVGREVPLGWEQHPAMVFTSVIRSYRDYAAILKALQWDIALVPLAEDDFNHSKTAIKWLEYSACGIASAFSDIDVYRDAVAGRSTGLLVKNTTQDWIDAIESLVVDSRLRRQIATNAQKQVRTRHAIADHAVAYDTVYGKWATAAYRSAPVQGLAPRPVKQKKCMVVYSVEPMASAGPQNRFILPFGLLTDHWDLVWGIRDGKLDMADLDRADLIVMHRYTPGLFDVKNLEAIFNKCKPVIYETDELLNDLPDSDPRAAESKRWKRGIEYVAERAQAIVVPNAFLAGRYRHLNKNVCVLPDDIDYGRFYRPVPLAAKKTVTIGLSGSALLAPNFALVEPALRSLCATYAGMLKLVFMGASVPHGWRDHPAVEFVPFIPAYQTYAERLLEMEWDIALVPLFGDSVNYGKSPVKWLEYAAAGIVAVCSDIAVYRERIAHGATGLLAADAGDAWLDAVTLLIEDPAMRLTLARAAQLAVGKEYDLRGKAALYDDLYDAVERADTPFLEAAMALTLVSQVAVTGVPQATAGRLRGVLLRDPGGEHERIQGSLDSVRDSAIGLSGDLVMVVLTTAAGMTPPWSHHLRYLQATPAEYEQALAHVTANAEFDWIQTVDV